MTEVNIPGVPAKPAVSAGLERIASPLVPVHGRATPAGFKDPDTIDHSIASVSIGAAPQMGRHRPALPRGHHRRSRSLGRQYSQVWIVGFNRQSLDRVVADMRTERTTTRDEDQE